MLDLGCGQGVLAPAIAAAGADYTGIDASPRLVALARRRHPRQRFLLGDARRAGSMPDCSAVFDAAIFLLSIQDMDPLHEVLASAAQALRQGGRLALVMTHPCFRIPRQSGWGWDPGRKLRYRRVDRYLTPLAVPWRFEFGDRQARTVSFHRPLRDYVNGLAANGLLIDRLEEIAALADEPSAREAGNPDIPVFLGLRAIKP